MESKHSLTSWVYAFFQRRSVPSTSSPQGGVPPSAQTLVPALPTVSTDVSKSNTLCYGGMPSVGTWHMSLPPQVRAPAAATPFVPPPIQACAVPPEVVAHHYIGIPRSQERSKPNSIEEHYDELNCSSPKPSLESAQPSAQAPLQAEATIPSPTAPVTIRQLQQSTLDLPQAATSSRVVSCLLSD